MAKKKVEEVEEQESSWSGLKKTLIGTLTTVILGGGTYLTTTLFGGHEDKIVTHELESEYDETEVQP